MELACPAERVYDKPEPVRAPQRDRGGPAPTHACSARTPGGGHDERWLDIMVGWEPDDVLAGAALRVPARGEWSLRCDHSADRVPWPCGPGGVVRDGAKAGGRGTRSAAAPVA